MTTGNGEPLPETLSMPPQFGVGFRLGRYELLHEIATGGMATVYLARARAVAGFERVVAIKVCHPHLRHEEEFSAMFLDEARLAAKIHHPNVVSTLDVSEGEQLYLVMEYVEGDRISGLIKAAAKRGERVPVPVTLRVMIDVLSGLHAAHDLKDNLGNPLNIVHRDVSPQNILVGVDGVTRITDFGIAKAEARLTVTRDGQVKGKMSYMAPEQLSSSNVTRRADVYAAGVVLWEALTGRRLFRADSEAETLNMVLHGLVPPPSTVAPEVPASLDAVLRTALERDPEKRFASAEEFADALENLEGVKVATTRAVSAYINELLAEPIARRRELVRKLSESGPQSITPVEHSGVRSNPGVGNPFASGTRTSLPGLPGSAAIAPVAAEADRPIEIEPEPSRGRRLAYALALVALLALVAGGSYLALRGRAPAAPPQPAPPAPVTALASESPPAPPPAPPPPLAAPATPETSTPPAPEAAPQEGQGRGRRGAARARPTRPAGATGASQPAQPTAPAQPAQPPGEFRPSGI